MGTIISPYQSFFLQKTQIFAESHNWSKSSGHGCLTPISTFTIQPIHLRLKKHDKTEIQKALNITTDFRLFLLSSKSTAPVHPQLCSRPPVTAPFLSVPAPKYHIDLYKLSFSPLIAYTSTKLLQAFPGQPVKQVA